MVGDRTNRGGSHGRFVIGIECGFVIEGKTRGHKSSGPGFHQKTLDVYGITVHAGMAKG